MSINFALKHIYSALRFRGVAMCLDSDMFPVVPVNPIERLGAHSFVGIFQARGNVRYYNNQLFICNFSKLINIQELNFLPGVMEGTHHDCGAHLHTYFKKHPQLSADRFGPNVASRQITCDTIDSMCPDEFRDYFDTELKHTEKAFAEIYEGKFLHFRAGTNWIGHDAETVFDRTDRLYTYLCRRLIGWNIPQDPGNKHVISTALYGNSPKYTYNAIVNAMIAQKVYQGWICRYYVDDTVSSEIIDTLASFDNVEIVRMASLRSPAGSERMLWRFHPASEPDVAAMISRDLNTWVTFRDAVLTKEWIESGKGLHIIRDHCYHSQKMMGGMWGIRRGAFPDMKRLCDEFSLSGTYDQGFLADIVYPQCVGDSLVHANPNQKKMGGAPANGYFPDHGKPFPHAPAIRCYIPGLDIEKVNDANVFKCAHCGKEHKFFIGNMTNNLTPELKTIVARRIEHK